MSVAENDGVKDMMLVCLTSIKDRWLWVGVGERRCFVQNIIIYAKGKILAAGVYGEKYRVYFACSSDEMLLRFLNCCYLLIILIRLVKRHLL